MHWVKELEYIDSSPYIKHGIGKASVLSEKGANPLSLFGFECLTTRMLNGAHVLSKLNPVLASISIYALCTGAGFILWIAMGFLDLAVGTHVLEAFFIVMERLNEHVLPALQLLNRLFSPLVGFSILLG